MISELYQDDGQIPESRRPALVRLALDVEELIDDLQEGFDHRLEVLLWMRRMIPRSLGEINTVFYRQMSQQFQGVGPGERTVLAALLSPSARNRDLDGPVVDRIRDEIALQFILPGFHRGLQSLRKSATEYVDDETSSDTDHDPVKQRYIAMRPAISELDELQDRCVREVISGFGNRDEIRQWGTLLELATHGEIEDGFVRRVTRERSTYRLLTADSPTQAQIRARILFVAYYLLPAMNRGVRDLRDRSKEELDTNQGPTAPTLS